MTTPIALAWELLAKDSASPAFLRVASAADKAATATQRSTASIAAASARMSKVGATLSKAVTLPLLGIAAVSVDQAAKFQKSMTLIQTAGGETEAKAKAIAAGIKEIAKSTGTSLGALSDGIYTVAKAGSQRWSAVDQLKVLKAASQGAKAENVDLGTATNALTSVMMSYHLGASQAVATQNELIVGAGQAKTTMQEYAGSLATVVPVASAAGISFAQVAGAIATLTQHGTSAQEATQELAFTIRNLQAPNNVAVSAMNQLGISSVNVASNLGKRGLTGTLQYIESFLPKTGLVFLTTMKQMEAGTTDLNTMIRAMPPSLAALSKGFLDGSVSEKNYRTGFRNLGADGYAQGTAFLSLAAKVNGYNDSLKAGSPAQKTMAAELKAIFGGATGLNTALQLGGENAAYFKTATDKVAAAAKSAGVDVLGWGKTQGTLAVQMDKAKANLQVLAVEIGTALIPAVTKIVSVVTSAFHWFENLSSGWKKFIGYTALAAAAIGPLLSIGGKLIAVFRAVGAAVVLTGEKVATAFGFMSASSVTNAEVEASSAALVAQAEADKALAVARAAAAIATSTTETDAVLLAGAEQAAQDAAVFAAAQQAKADAATLAAEEIIAAAEEEGAASSLALGPIGLAVAGIVAVGAGLIGFFHHSSSAASQTSAQQVAAANRAKAALEAQKETIQGISAAYDADNSAIARNTRARIAADLAAVNTKSTTDQPNALALASSLGLNLDAVTNSTFDLKTRASLATELQKKIALFTKLAGIDAPGKGNIPGTAAEMDPTSAVFAQEAAARQKLDDVNALAKALGIETGNVNKAIQAQDLLNEAQGIAAFKSRTAAQQVDIYGTALGASTDSGRANDKWIAEHVAALAKQKGSITDNTLALYNQMVAQGYNSGSILSMISNYEKVPKEVFTKALLETKDALTKKAILQAEIDAIKQHKVPGVDADTKAGKALIASLQKQLDAIKQHHVPTVSVNTGTAVSGLDSILAKLFQIGNTKVKPTVLAPNLPILNGGLLPGHAAGGLIRGAGTGTSDSNLRRVSNGEFVVNAASTARNLPLLQSINKGIAGFSGGGPVGNTARYVSPSSSGQNIQGLQLQAAQEQVSVLKSGIARLESRIDSIGRQVADALNGTARSSASYGATRPAGRR